MILIIEYEPNSTHTKYIYDLTENDKTTDDFNTAITGIKAKLSHRTHVKPMILFFISFHKKHTKQK